MSDIFEDIMNFKGELSKKDSVEEEKLKTLKPSERLLEFIKSNGFNLSQMENILKTMGNQLVISCAGSGKTTSLTFKLMYDIKTGYATKVVNTAVGTQIRCVDSMWVSTFLKTGAEELKSSFRVWSRKAGMPDVADSIHFSTINAEFYQALKEFGFVKSVVTESVNSGYLKKVLKPYMLQNSYGKALNSVNMRDLESALAFTRNCLDRTKRYNYSIYNELNLTSCLIDSILADWKKERFDNGVIDFDDMQELIYEECYVRNNSKFISFIMNRYKHIYIDEFQDISQIQYAILKVYMQQAKQVFAIGDDDQTIYTWRGSDNKIILHDFKEDFSPVINQLSINYRCPSNILNAIIPSISKNENRYDKSLKSSNEGGEVCKICSGTYFDMVNKMVESVCADLNNGMSVAILCRVNTDGIIPAIMFDKLGRFSYSISSKGMTLDSFIGNSVISIIKLFTENATASTKRALGMLVYGSYAVNQLVDVMKTNKKSIWTINPADLSYSCPEISEYIMKWRSWRESFGDIVALSKILAFYRTVVFAKSSQFNDVVRSTIMAVEMLLSYSNYDSVADFLYDLEYMNDRLMGRIQNRMCFVKIVTVHEFKGKEADSVYVWNDSVDVFPQKLAIEKGSEDSYEEERRIHYIACTRARKKSTIVYKAGSMGSFAQEMDLSNATEPDVKGSLLKNIQENTEEESNRRRFLENIDDGKGVVADKSETESSQFDGDTKPLIDFSKIPRTNSTPVVAGVNAPIIGFNENEFWGTE